ncbi:MAG: hypothetical protein DRG30_03130 [Epsilonproteobacteria bacterium]|nr:MAG: hypothetical protein DRG30_03130 [Campylobacterota bacterium]
MSLTTYGETFALKKLFGESVPSRTSNYLGLGFGSDADGILSEISAVGYSRTSIAVADWSVSLGTVVNSVAVNLASTSESFGSPTSWGIFDTQTNGNCLFTGVINPTKEIGLNQQIYFPVGELNLTLEPISSGSGLSEYWRGLVLSDLVGKTNTTAPTMYVGFSSADITSVITGESFVNGYARSLFGTAELVTDSTNKAVTKNATVITFTITGPWEPNLIRVFISDSATLSASENLLFVGTIPSMSPDSGDIVEIEIGDYLITME